MTFKFNIGDKIESIYSPGKYHTITKRYKDGLGRNIYHWEGGIREEKHVKLISKSIINKQVKIPIVKALPDQKTIVIV